MVSDGFCIDTRWLKLGFTLPTQKPPRASKKFKVEMAVLSLSVHFSIFQLISYGKTPQALIFKGHYLLIFLKHL